MKPHIAGTVNRLNVEHRTSNIERPILKALRFIYFTTSEPQPATSSAVSNIEQEISNDEVWNRCAQFFFKYNNDRIPYFDIRYSLFDIRYSLFQSFFFD
jgi:hypothetical protein